MLNYIRLVGLSLLLSMSVGSVSKAESLDRGMKKFGTGISVFCHKKQQRLILSSFRVVLWRMQMTKKHL